MLKILYKHFLVLLIVVTPSISLAQNLKTKPRVEILVASWCVHCRDLEKFLQSESVGYTRLDIEKDAEGKRLYKRFGGGGVPMTIIGNTVLRGFDKTALLEVLDKQSIPVAFNSNSSAK